MFIRKDKNRIVPLCSSQEVYQAYCGFFATEPQEIFLAIGVNNKNVPVVEHIAAVGTATECRVNPRDVFREVLKAGAVRMMLLHNHPSGDFTPSPQDVALTKRLQKGGEILGVSILDHVVVSDSGYASMNDLGLMGTEQDSEERKAAE